MPRVPKFKGWDFSELHKPLKRCLRDTVAPRQAKPGETGDPLFDETEAELEHIFQCLFHRSTTIGTPNDKYDEYCTCTLRQLNTARRYVDAYLTAYIAEAEKMYQETEICKGLLRCGGKGINHEYWWVLSRIFGTLWT